MRKERSRWARETGSQVASVRVHVSGLGEFWDPAASVRPPRRSAALGLISEVVSAWE
jgi:hypothetical protein